MKPLEELRLSEWHQDLGRKICAAYVAQQQGIAVGTALKTVPTPVGDLWLQLAEFARAALNSSADSEMRLLRAGGANLM